MVLQIDCVHFLYDYRVSALCIDQIKVVRMKPVIRIVPCIHNLVVIISSELKWYFKAEQTKVMPCNDVGICSLVSMHTACQDFSLCQRQSSWELFWWCLTKDWWRMLSAALEQVGRLHEGQKKPRFSGRPSAALSYCHYPNTSILKY